MKRLFALVAGILVMGLVISSPAVADETSGATYNSPNGQAEGITQFLNQQECVDHNHQYTDQIGRETDAAFIFSLDNVIHTPVSWFQARVKPMYDFNNRKTDGHGWGYELGGIIHWGQGGVVK